MSCTPLDIQNGLFINAVNWDTSHNKSFDGKNLTLTTSGPNPGISVQQGGNSIFHAQLANHSLSHMVLGGKFLVILDMESGVGSGTRTVSLVNFSNWTEVNILTVLANSNAVPPPIVNPSAGTGAVFLAFGQDGTQQTSLAIYRSDNGNVLCSVGSIIPTGQTLGEATASDLIIHYSTGGKQPPAAVPPPAGQLLHHAFNAELPQRLRGRMPVHVSDEAVHHTQHGQ